jgi:hypothetical protein
MKRRHKKEKIAFVVEVMPDSQDTTLKVLLLYLMVQLVIGSEAPDTG